MAAAWKWCAKYMTFNVNSGAMMAQHPDWDSAVRHRNSLRKLGYEIRIYKLMGG